jgi:hypothetical protein
MHDPDVVAFDINRPWPRRTRYGKKRLYWPAMITIWHHDPGDYDCFDQCPHDSNWRWHIHHWRIQIRPLQHFRRWALTRCSVCGGRSTKTYPVNCTNMWDAPKTPWWGGETHLYHSRCP